MERKETVSGLEDHLGYWLRFVSNHVSLAFARKVEEKGVTVAEWVLLREMLQTHAANPSLLADKLGMTRGAISKLVDRVCDKKLAERTTSGEDRRYQSVSLTPAGKKLVPILARLADENDREYFGHLESEQRTLLIHLLREIVSMNQWRALPVQ
ncbi:MAG: MarR family winged helix-turn-helix transcriptional regulator [Planctomycetota bacterium]